MKYKQLVRNAVTTFKKTDNNENNVHVVSIYIYIQITKQWMSSMITQHQFVSLASI